MFFIVISVIIRSWKDKNETTNYSAKENKQLLIVITVVTKAFNRSNRIF